MITHGARIMEALSTGPKFAGELPGPLEKLTYRITGVNVFHEKIHSHWRIRGEQVYVAGPITGRKMRTVLYTLVME